MTATTSSTVMPRVISTSATEARMVWVRSATMRSVAAGGMLRSSCGSAALTRSTVWMTLAPGCLKIASWTLWPAL